MRGFLYLELLISIFLIALFSLLFFGWYKGYLLSDQKITQYYAQREELINRSELGEGTESYVTKNIVLKKLATGNIQLEYLEYVQ